MNSDKSLMSYLAKNTDIYNSSSLLSALSQEASLHHQSNIVNTSNLLSRIASEASSQNNTLMMDALMSFSNYIGETLQNTILISELLSTKIVTILNSISEIDFSDIEQLNIEIDASDLTNPVKEISETVEKLELSSKEATISDDRPIIVINNFISNNSNKKIDPYRLVELFIALVTILIMFQQNFEKDKTDKLFLDALNGIGTKISTSINNKD